MATARRIIVDPNYPGIYHCFSTCVRSLPLFGGRHSYRKKWIEERMFELRRVMAIEIFGFSILDNHFHMIIKARPDIAKGLPEPEVARRYLIMCPSKRKSHQSGIKDHGPPTEADIAALRADPERLKRNSQLHSRRDQKVGALVASGSHARINNEPKPSAPLRAPATNRRPKSVPVLDFWLGFLD